MERHATRKPLLTTLLFVYLLACGCAQPSGSTESVAEPIATKTKLRLLAYNIKHGLGGGSPAVALDTSTANWPTCVAVPVATTMPWDLHLAMGPELAGVSDVFSKSGTTDENGKVVLGPLPPENYGVVVVEDLQIANMTASAKGTDENPGKNVAAKAGLSLGSSVSAGV